MSKPRPPRHWRADRRARRAGPAASASAITTALSLGSSPKIRTSQSIGSDVCSLCAATLWKAATTLAPSPSRCCAASAAEISGGSCTRATFGGTSGTVVSTTILPAVCGLISSRIWAWFDQGTVRMTTSAAFAASALEAPRGAGAPPLATSAAAAACALSAAARPDDDRVARSRPAHGQPRPERAGAADDRERGFAGRHSSSSDHSFMSGSGTIAIPASSRPLRMARATATPVASSPWTHSV